MAERFGLDTVVARSRVHRESFAVRGFGLASVWLLCLAFRACDGCERLIATASAYSLSMRTAAAVALQHASHDLAASAADSALSKAEDAKAEAVKALIKTQAAALPRMAVF